MIRFWVGRFSAGLGLLGAGEGDGDLVQPPVLSCIGYEGGSVLADSSGRHEHIRLALRLQLIGQEGSGAEEAAGGSSVEARDDGGVAGALPLPAFHLGQEAEEKVYGRGCHVAFVPTLQVELLHDAGLGRLGGVLELELSQEYSTRSHVSRDVVDA
uniref:Putative secreted protein n=1 Tax=Ixodes ricinus TaxID=34613 RepID=A0A6B0UWW8_IXORI